MGASVSTSIQETTNEMITGAYQSCPPQSVTNKALLNNVTYVAPPNCPADSTGFVLNQTAAADATCVLNSLSTVAATQAATISTDAQAGLGFSIGTSVQDTTNNVLDYTSQQCAGQSTSNLAVANDLNIQSCDATIVQGATAMQACQIDNTQDLIGKIAADQVTESVGFKFGIIILVVVVIIILLVVVGGVAIFLLSNNNDSASAPVTPNNSTTLSISPEIPAADIQRFTEVANGFSNSLTNPVYPQVGSGRLSCLSVPILIIIIAGLIIVSLTISAKNSCNKKEIIYSPAAIFYSNQPNKLNYIPNVI